MKFEIKVLCVIKLSLNNECRIIEDNEDKIGMIIYILLIFLKIDKNLLPSDKDPLLA